MSSSASTERNKKMNRLLPAQRKAAALVRHKDMAQKLHEYVQANDIKKSSIKKSTLFNKKMYHSLLNDDNHIGYDISKSMYEIFMKM